jgi:hypothetical protein
MDSSVHGTAMAGVIGAAGNNSVGIVGVNWKARIMALKFSSFYIEDAITCINYAMEMKVAYNYRMVIVLGWKTSGYSKALRDVLRLAQFKGILVVAAAGDDDEDNDLYPVYPAGYNAANHGLNNIISVGASDRNDLKANYIDYYTPGSNYGCAGVDLFAPGRDILTTTKGSFGNYDNAYDTESGTSLAAAHVAGAAALVWSKNTGLTWKGVKGLLLNGSEDGKSNDFRPICTTWGRLNAANAMAAALIDDPAVYEVHPARATAGTAVTVFGNNFGNAGSGGVLSFLYGSSIPITSITSWGPNRIVFTVPNNLPKGVGRLQVKTASGTSRDACFIHVTPEVPVPGQPLILERGFAASAQVGNDVYVIGGYTSYGLTGLVEKYDLSTQTTIIECKWQMPIAVSNAGAAAINSKIYVVGGLDDADTVRDTVQVFDTATKKWGPLAAKLPQALMQPTVVSLGGTLYVFGGTPSPSSAPVSKVYAYNPSTNSWAGKTSMPTAVSYAAGAPYGTNRIWVMGGFSGTYTKVQQRAVQEYNPAQDTWASRPHLIRPRAGAAGISTGTKVFCLHGTPLYGYPYYADKYGDGEWYNPVLGYWMHSILMEPYTPYAGPRRGLYTPSPGKYSPNIFLLGGVIEKSYNDYTYSHLVWYFKSP